MTSVLSSLCHQAELEASGKVSSLREELAASKELSTVLESRRKQAVHDAADALRAQSKEGEVQLAQQHTLLHTPLGRAAPFPRHLPLVPRGRCNSRSNGQWSSSLRPASCRASRRLTSS